MEEKKRFLSRLIRMYGDDYSKLLYKDRLNEEVTDEMLEEAKSISTEEDEGIDLNLM